KIRRVTSAPATETTAEQGHLFIKANRNFTKVAFDDIRYVEALKNHVKVITTDELLLTLTTISDFCEKLPAGDFIRVHRSFIVNRKHITAFNSTEIGIGPVAIPIGRSYREEVRGVLEDLLM
ncbi:MAG: LytTR family transcriptional regulator, partial [Phaeodactylibacter sp.]|nr:LytTR family transcriptional regulator [Phaeodactylibacter sp.]